MNQPAQSKIQIMSQLQTLVIFLVSSIVIQAHGAPDDVDLSFDPGSTVNGTINALALQSDGKVVIAGQFSTVHGVCRGNIARLNPDGSTDGSFLNDMEGPDNGVSCLALQADGKLLIGGSFLRVNGEQRQGLARLHPDGSLDETLVTRIGFLEDMSVDCLSLQDDGKILIGGRFTSVNGEPRTGIVRLNADGTTDESFAVTLADYDWIHVSSVAMEPDRRILLAGSFGSVNGISKTNLARVNSNGSLDSTFPKDVVEGDVYAIAPQAEGTILLGGSYTINGEPWGLAKLNRDGSLDPSFVRNELSAVAAITVQADGRILAGGSFQLINGEDHTCLARFGPDGARDSSFVVNIEADIFANWCVLCCAIQPDGRILIGGGFGLIGGKGRIEVARLFPNGSLDTSFENGPSGPDGYIDSLAVQSDGKILIGGPFRTFNGEPCSGLARLNPDGSLDRLLAVRQEAEAWHNITAVHVQSDGKILIGGMFESMNGAPRTNIARFNPDGSLDDSFIVENGAEYASPRAVAVQSDGRVILCLASNLVRLNADGRRDTSFLSTWWQGLYGLALQADGRIIIRGDLPGGIMRLSVDGSPDSSFHNALLARGQVSVGAFALQNDGKILVSGRDASGGGQWFVRLLSDGAMDKSFVVSDYSAHSIALQSSGKIVIAGFNYINGAYVQLLRLNPDGSFDEGFLNHSQGSLVWISTVGTQPDGKILIGGNFAQVNEAARSFIARLMGDYAPVSLQSAPQSRTVELGSAVGFAASAVGYPEPVYQWYFNHTNLLSAGTNSELRLTNVQPVQAGSYLVVVTNAGGGVTSPPALLSVIPRVERRIVPAIQLGGTPGSLLHLEYLDTLELPQNWQNLADVTLSATSDYYFDITLPVPAHRFIRARQNAPVNPECRINLVPALTLAGPQGSMWRVDYIDEVGPVDAWRTLDTITLTNTAQLYFDTSVIGRPARLWRVVPVP